MKVLNREDKEIYESMMNGIMKKHKLKTLKLPKDMKRDGWEGATTKKAQLIKLSGENQKLTILAAKEQNEP